MRATRESLQRRGSALNEVSIGTVAFGPAVLLDGLHQDLLGRRPVRELWARHDVRALEGGTAAVNHPLVGDLELYRDKLPVGDLLLVMYYPDQHSDSAEKLQMLASLASGDAVPDPERDAST